MDRGRERNRFFRGKKSDVVHIISSCELSRKDRAIYNAESTNAFMEKESATIDDGRKS